MTDEKPKQTLASEDVTTSRVSRRASVALIGAALGSVVLTGSSVAEAQCSDADPYDPGGRGRHCGRPPVTGCSDSDPYDPGGNGRHCQAGCAPCRGISDSDPRDPSGCGCRSCSDSDPYDPGGQGRRC